MALPSMLTTSASLKECRWAAGETSSANSGWPTVEINIIPRLGPVQHSGYGNEQNFLE